MKIAISVLLALGATAAQAQDDPAARIRRRLELEMKDALDKTRKSVLEFVAKELAAAGIGERSLAAQIDKFSKNLVDDALHGRLKKLLLSKDGRELVEQFMSEQNMDDLETLVESYFEKNKNGKYRVREEFAEILEQMLDNVAPVDAPKGAEAGSLPVLGLKFVPDAKGIKVIEVTDGGPVSKTGLRKGDVIIDLNGKALTAANVNELVKALPLKTEFFITYTRANVEYSMKMTLEDRRSK